MRHPEAKDAAITNVTFGLLDRLRILFHGQCSVRVEAADVLNILASGVTVPRVFYWPWRRRGYSIEAGHIGAKAPRATLPGALILCALVLLAGTARADAPVDAGAPLDVPVELQAGQPAPFHGYELSDARAQTLLLNQQTAEPAPAVNGAVVALLAGTGFVVGVLLGAYLEAKAAK